MQVELRQIHKHFGPVRANDGISFTLEGGRIYGLLGENGAGKSTLMKVLSGFLAADSGSILLDGEQQDFQSPADGLAAGVGMLYQEPLDFPPFRVVEDYMLGRARGFALDRQKARRELQELGRRYKFDIDPEEDIASLSVGERQQLELVRLLAGGAEVLILDEPTTGISAEQKELLFDSMRRLAHEEGKTLLLVSHKLSEVQELCEYVYVLRSGQLVGESAIPCPNKKLVGMMFKEMPPRSQRAAMARAQVALRVEQLSIATHRFAVQDINLELRQGEVLGLAGLEGSGQDLLLQALAGLVSIESGRILLNGEDVAGNSYHEMRRAGIAYLPAGRLEEGLVAGLSLSEHMVLAATEQDFLVDWSGARARTTRRIEQQQVVGFESSLVDQLSGGNQQRFLFAMLNRNLKLILMENPTRGLDVRSVDWIWQQLNQRREQGTAIVFFSPDLDEVIERSDRIAVFFGGRMSRVLKAENTNVDALGHMIGGEQ